MTARCYLRTEYFSSFALNDEYQIEFVVDISTLIQVLTIFGMESHFNLEFNKSNNYLQVFLTNNDQNCITDCQLFTYESSDSAVDLQWSQYRVINQLSAKSEYFRDIFSEIDALARNEALVWFQIDRVEADQDEEKEMMMMDGVNGMNGNDSMNQDE